MTYRIRRVEGEAMPVRVDRIEDSGRAVEVVRFADKEAAEALWMIDYLNEFEARAARDRERAAREAAERERAASGGAEAARRFEPEPGDDPDPYARLDDMILFALESKGGVDRG